jgi:DNA segregation ATPase FtsK/SpoIIIE, S-DNA-T family
MRVERVIVLSWIQNFFQKLKRDEEDEFDESFLHNDKTGAPHILSSKDNHKDVETRISYQYPKSGLPISSETRKTPMAKQHKKRREKHHNNQTDELPVVTPVKKEAPKAGKEQPAKYRRPFHPTEIPSPVFGFKRPEKQNVAVEHELSHFSEEVAARQIEPEVITASDSLNWILEETQVDLILEEPVSEDTTYRASPEKLERDIEEPIQSQETMVSLQEEPIQSEETMVSPQEEPIQSEETMVSLQEEPIQSEETMVNPQEGPIQSEETMVSPQEEPESLLKPDRPKRSHLPFKVMMLKQDRAKGEARKMQRDQIQELQPSASKSQRDQIQESKPSDCQDSKQETVQVVKANQAPVKTPEPSLNFQALPEVAASSQEKQEQTVLIPETQATEYYKFPDLGLLYPPISEEKDMEWLLYQEELLNQTLINFNVGAHVVNITQGPSVTRFEVQPEPGVKVNKITNLSDDIKLSLAARDIRIEAPIPGKHTIGIEVPNQKSRPVRISEIVTSNAFLESTSPLTAVLGLDIAGKPVVTDLKKMPHGLIAGATGSGKSVCINSILVSLLYKASPEDLKLLLIDPKMVELAPYNSIPHLVSPVITDVKAATAALKWAVEEMDRRYELFAHTGVRDINRFNELAVKHKQYSDKLPYIVIIIDELADLMMMSPADVEEAICRIAQKARACGIHLIVATQRPSVDVITGLIKANIPTRVSFSVSSQVDSRTIIDISGAEKLLGRGDMLFLENGSSKPVRLQGTFVSDEEIDLVVAHVKAEREPDYLFVQEELLKKAQVSEEEDELFYDACEFIIEQGGASTSSLQRRFKIGYNRAARLMDIMEKNGYISGANGSKPREVLITESDLESIQEASLNM